MTALDDLEVGSWIAFHSHIEDDDVTGHVIWTTPMGQVMQPSTPRFCIDGTPLQILAMSLPFVIVRSPLTQTVFSIDLRTIRVMLLEFAYVETILQCSYDDGGLKSMREPPAGVFRDNTLGPPME